MSLIARTNNQDIDGILWGVKWDLPSLTYGFATSTSEYTGYYFGSIQGFSEFNVFQKAAVNDIVPMLDGLIGLPITATSDPTMANLRFAEADFVDQGSGFFGTIPTPGNIPTAVGTPPDPFSTQSYAYGDMFFHSLAYISPVKGNFAYNTLIHELGHALGLKHGHVTDQKYPGSNIILPALPTNHDSMEFSVMTYRSEVGGITDHYTNEDFGYAQTYMMDDIAALQYLYGADSGFNSGDTAYSWDRTIGEMFIDGVGQGAPGANRIFLTVWDGGGTDTYDFSNYVTNLHVNLAPGKWSTAAHNQLAILDTDTGHRARGSIFNALLHNNDARSLIENATGGRGNDKIMGNFGDNDLIGRGGADKLLGKAGSDTLIGGNGDDTLIGGGGGDRLQGIKGNDVLIAGNGKDFLNGGGGGDKLLGGPGADTLRGGSGSDTLNGGEGHDVMDGQRGSDTFEFKNVSDTSADAHRDVIQHFVIGKDMVDLSAIDAETGVQGDQAFHFIGTQAFSGAKGELHALRLGGNSRVEGDIDGDGHADFSFLIQSVTGLTGHDFIL